MFPYNVCLENIFSLGHECLSFYQGSSKKMKNSNNMAISLISDSHFSKDPDTPSLPKTAHAIYGKLSEFEIRKITIISFFCFKFFNLNWSAWRRRPEHSIMHNSTPTALPTVPLVM
jgi:hypothetical protein